MTTFVYKAKKNTAETVTGQINAQNEEEAIDLINQLGLLPVSVEIKSSDISKVSPRGRRVKNREVYIFSRQLANLLKSGISLLRAITIIEDQTQHQYFKGVIAQLGWNIKNGQSFSDALKAYPKIFSPLYVTMISAGEESGNLQQMLVSVANYQKKQEELFSKVRSALAYPLLMAVVGVLTIYFILTFVLPKMAGLFENIGDSLPLPTVFLLNLSSFLSKGWYVILLAGAGLFILISRWMQSQKGRFVWNRFFLSFPLVGNLILKSELARFCRTLVLLLNSGVSIIKSLDISIPILSNVIIKKQLLQCKVNLTSGGSFGEGVRESVDLPPMMGHLISVGEESGSLGDVLTEIAETYEQETDEIIKTVTNLFEPIMILLVGLIIGFIVFAMLLPIFQVDVLAG